MSQQQQRSEVPCHHWHLETVQYLEKGEWWNITPSPCTQYRQEPCLTCSYVLDHPLDVLLQHPMTSSIEQAICQIRGGPMTPEDWEQYTQYRMPSLPLLRYLKDKIDLEPIFDRMEAYGGHRAAQETRRRLNGGDIEPR